MRCASCGFDGAAEAKFCEECGAPFVRLCSSCGQQMRPTAKFCPECGTPRKATEKPAPARRRKSTKSAERTPRPVTRPTTAKPRVTAREAERRQLTVMFCDLVGSTALSAQLDPEDYRAVVQRYQQTCTEVIQRHDGHLAQYLGDGLLVYFGYPTAHEDDARRAVRAGLLIIETLREAPNQSGPPLQVRIGIHTGLVVVGEIGAGSRTEQLALGETPNVAARIQNLAEPNTVVISAATHRLIDSQFECQPFGSHLVKGIAAPIAVYHVQSERQGVSPLAGRATLTPLVGREQEVGLLLDRWEQAKEGRGQVVLLSGEPGIGKSRLAYTLREHVTREGSLLFEARCSPYHQHSALSPLIEVLRQTVLLTRQETDDEKVSKLARALALSGMQDTLPLFTALLSLPTPAQYPPLNLTPQKQKGHTLQALLQLLLAQAERQATVSVWEDVHWADPSSLEFLTLLVEQIPTTKLLLVLTFRPEFTPPWKPRSHLSQLVLNRLGRKQVEAMIAKVAEGQTLSAEVIEQIRVKTDGVPLFVEELTKSVVETAGTQGRPPLQPLAIPTTLQEALLALSSEQGFAVWLAEGAMLQGWVLAMQGQPEAGVAQMRQGLIAYRATGTETWRPCFLAGLAESYKMGGQGEEGLSILAEAVSQVEKTGERWYEAELYRLKGELSLQASQGKPSRDRFEGTNPQPPIPNPHAEAEACFHKAIEIARRQQAKSLELRAVMSLVRLRQYQAQDHAPRNTHHGSHATRHEAHARLNEAHKMLSELYHWFTEGFDTKDLQEAKALLEELEGGR